MNPMLGKRAARAALFAAAVLAVGMAGAAESMKSDSKMDEKKTAAVAVFTQDIIDAMDTDKNHEVSKAEFLEFMSKEFDRLDVNHDGKLQQTEILNKPVLGQQKSSVSHR